MNEVDDGSRYSGLCLGAFLFLLTLLFPSPWENLPDSGWHVLGLIALMAVYWITEAVPVPVTAFLPLVISPLLDISTVKAVSQSYAHPLIFLFLGGFLLSLAMEKWHLHKRIALMVMVAAGSRPAHQIGGIMLITAFLSMWMSNTATAVMMLPIGLSVIRRVCGEQRAHPEFATALLLAIAYSASIGGMATLIGTPPNALLAAYLLESYQVELSFSRWMLMALPVTAVLLAICWFWLTRVSYPQPQSLTCDSRALLYRQLISLGKWSGAEKVVAGVFLFTACCWVFRPLIAEQTGLNLTDSGIAMGAATLLFILPGELKKRSVLLTWRDTQRLPWGTLILFGGGLSLATQVKDSGLADFIGHSLGGAEHWPLWLVIIVVTCAIIFITEITSNTATTAGLLPLLGPVAVAMSQSPASLAIPAAMAASCAFMMPVATPPNSVVFASGQLKVKDMMRAGLVLNIIATLVISSLGYSLITWLIL